MGTFDAFLGLPLFGQYNFCVEANDRNSQVWLTIVRPEYFGAGCELVILLTEKEIDPLDNNDLWKVKPF